MRESVRLPSHLPPAPVDPAPRVRTVDVIEADYVVVTPPAATERGPRSVSPPPLPGLETLRRPAEPVRQKPFSRRGGPAFWLVGALGVAASFWASGGHALFVARPGPDAGLALAMLHSGVETAGGRAVLRVETETRNGSRRATPAPPLSILVTTGKGTALRYAVAILPDEIEPGGRRRITTSLPAPPDGVRAVSVAFAN